MSSLNPYAAAHENPQGEGDARPTALQIVHDEGLVNKMSDKVIMVTGSSSGLGIETVRALHATGAHIFMHVRDMKKGQQVLEEILATSEGKGKLELLPMELDSFKSIRAGAAEFLKKSNKLNVLVNNAGKYSLRAEPQELTDNVKASATHQKEPQSTASKHNSAPTTSATSSSSTSSSRPSSPPAHQPSTPAS